MFSPFDMWYNMDAIDRLSRAVGLISGKEVVLWKLRML
jgi:hypothetical protein